MGHQILLISVGVVFLTTNIVSGVRYVGDVVPKPYSDCFNNSQKIYLVELTCDYGGLIHISSLALSSTSSCGSRPFCRWTRPPYLIRACEGKEYCRYRLGSHYIPCSSFNQIEVTFQCIDALYVRDMCPVSTRTANHIGSTYFTTPGFPESAFQNDAEANCECRINSPKGSIIHLDLIYLDLEGINSTFCFDYLEFNDGSRSCSSPDSFDAPVRKTFSSPTAWRFVSDFTPVKNGGWLKVTLDGAGIYLVTCTSQVTPTTSRTVSYHWTTQPFQHYDYGPVVGGIIGGISLICVLCVLTLVWRSRRRNTAMRGERNLRAPPHAAIYNNPAAMTGSIEELPNSRAASYELPPAYSTLPPEILAKGSDGISPPPPYTSGPV